MVGIFDVENFWTNFDFQVKFEDCQGVYEPWVQKLIEKEGYECKRVPFAKKYGFQILTETLPVWTRESIRL